jgi:MinD superfamily P-loop ATPase
VAELAAHFRIPGMVCVNKYDLNPDQTDAIEKQARMRSLAFLGRIPFDTDFTQAMVGGQTIIEYRNQSSTIDAVKNIWDKIISSKAMNTPKP